MKFVLKKNHEHNGELFLEGTEVDFPEDVIEAIKTLYRQEKIELIEELKKHEEVLDNIKQKKNSK